MVSCVRLKRHWRRRSRLEKQLYVVSLVLSLTIVCLIISICAISIRETDPSPGHLTCQSKECKERGKKLRSWIDASVDPCDDFYNHCCGGWLRENPLPPNTEIYGRFEELQVKIDKKVKELLARPINDKNPSRSIAQMHRFYNACLDTEGIDARGTTPLLNFLEELGGWPLLSSDWNGTGYDWVEAISSLVRRAMTGYIIRFIISPDPKNTTNIYIQLDRPSLLNLPEWLLNINETTNTSALNQRKEIIKKVALFLNASNRDLESEIEGIFDFERSLAKMMVPVEEYSKSAYNKATVEEFQSLLPKFELLRYLQLITNETLAKNASKPISSDDVIIIRDIFYLQNLTAFVAEQPNVQRQIANYLGWMTIDKFKWNLPSELAEILSDSNSTTERWRHCLTVANLFMEYAVAHVYIAENDWSVHRNNVNEMVEKQKTIFKGMLEDAAWMDDQTRKEALRKIEAMKSQIGYPDWLMNKEGLDEFYQQMGEIGEDPFKNYLIVSEYSCSKLIMELREKPKHSKWPISPLTVNAVYHLLENTITVPVVTFQYPIYGIELPRYINYATIGFIIGHEITHGFDNKGSQRDELGNEVNWWTNTSREHFNTRANCFVEQYNSYGVNGELKLTENIADNGGIRNAYLGYKMWEEEKGSQPLLLPGFEDYTADQLFFLSYCTLFCTQYGDRGWNISSFYQHSQAPYRIRGPISNMKEFSEVFKCNSSKKMNPEEKCRVW